MSNFSSWAADILTSGWENARIILNREKRRIVFARAALLRLSFSFLEYA